MHAGYSPIQELALGVGNLIRRRRRAPPPRPAPATLTPRPQPAPAAHPVIAALAKAGRPLNNLELARAIGRSPGQASRLRRQVETHLATWREGKCLYATLKA